VEDPIEELKSGSSGDKALLFQRNDNGSYLYLDSSSGTSLPKKVGKVYHIQKKLVVASRYVLDPMVNQILRIVGKIKPRVAVVILSMPCYLDPCCMEHGGEFGEGTEGTVDDGVGEKEGDPAAAEQVTHQKGSIGVPH